MKRLDVHFFLEKHDILNILFYTMIVNFRRGGKSDLTSEGRGRSN